MNSLFFEILQVAIGTRKDLSIIPTDKQWGFLYKMAQHQAVVGIMYTALDLLCKDLKELNIPRGMMYELIGFAEQIKARNILLNKKCEELMSVFTEQGFRVCVLKGQGNALSYDYPYSRTSGDIDLWLEGGKEKVVSYVRSVFPNARMCDWNIEYPRYKDVNVEVHFIPQYLCSKKYNRRLQKYFCELSDEQFVNYSSNNEIALTLCVPTPECNLIIQLAHVIGHFFEGGIGMRHIIDLYYVLKDIHASNLKVDFIELLEHLGMLKFASGIMWVIKETLSPGEEIYVVEPSTKIGKILLEQIMDGGNFGQFRMHGNLQGHGIMMKGLLFFERQLQMFPIFPSEATGQILYVCKLQLRKSLNLFISRIKL